jgi:peptidyl-prolyl cis-trans isomerase A (cyclophilin A)
MRHVRRMNLRLLLPTLVAPALLVAGCEHKSPHDDSVEGKNPWTEGSNKPKPAAKPAEVKTEPVPRDQKGPLTPPADSGDDVRAPTAADLDTYTKDIKGTGKQLTATIATSMGTFHCELFADKTPMTVANFIGLATGKKPWKDPKSGEVVKNKPFFDGLTFHRVIKDFMIQGGDPLGTGTGGPGYRFADEFSPDLKMSPGTMAMANSGPGTNGSQFFITEGSPDWLNGKHTIFGKCKETELVKQIEAVPQNAANKPDTPVTIDKVTISKA